jgi:ABC-type sugar transport system substrate-binding protein
LNEDSGGGGEQGKQTTKIIVSVVAIIAASIMLVIYFRSSGLSSASVAPLAALGEVTAQETAKLLDNKGSIVVVTRDTSQYPAPEFEVRLKAFQRTAKQHGLTLAATEAARGETDFTDDGLLRSDFYLNLLKKYPDAAAIVSFVGPPALSSQQIRALPQKISKLIVVSLADVSLLNRLLRSGVIQVAIVNRTGPAPQSGKKPASTRETFDLYFQVVTADSAGS